MNKKEFIASLRSGLKGLPQKEIEERVIFYSEMIDDRIEEGFSEADAVAFIGSVDTIISQIAPENQDIKEKKPKRKMGAWEIVLIVLGFPVWFSLLTAVFSVAISLYGALWAVIISLWAVFASFVACGFAGIIAGITFIFVTNPLTGVAMIGAGITLIGLSIFTFFGCHIATKGALILIQKTAIAIKKALTKKEAAK
ncbi:MAG: DUF1700 domain-containing protein [Ruminococcaceae bacterium]|nr:DUF1700 domain-containing protein [Oscillospiraceae bacterium]